jgi:heterodisulfide reductase subunit A
MNETQDENKEPRIGVFVCRCGINIAGVVNCPEVVSYAEDVDGVIVAEEYLSYCTEGGARAIKEAIDKHDLDRIVIAACTPKTHQPVFQAVLKEAGINERMLEFVNIRDHDSFIHMKEKSIATEKANELINAAVARAKLLEEVPIEIVDINPNILVVGGGIAGLTAAVDLANQPKVEKVYLVEKKNTIGGRMAQLDRTFPTDDCSI